MPERLRPFWSKHWRINGTSALLDIKNFNMCVNMPQDVLHVLLEGSFEVCYIPTIAAVY